MDGVVSILFVWNGAAEPHGTAGVYQPCAYDIYALNVILKNTNNAERRTAKRLCLVARSVVN